MRICVMLVIMFKCFNNVTLSVTKDDQLFEKEIGYSDCLSAY